MNAVKKSTTWAILCRIGGLVSACLLVSLCRDLVLRIPDLVRDSRLYRALAAEEGALQRFFRRFSALVKESNLFRLLTEEGPWQRLWKSSLTCAFLGWLLNRIPRALTPKTPSPAGESASLLGRGLDALAPRRHILAGGLFLLMLCVPYELWNNLYGAAGAAAIFLAYYLWDIPRRRARPIEARELSPMHILFLLGALAAFVFSAHPGLSLRFLIFHFACALIAFTVLGSVETVKQLRTMLYLVLTGLLAACVYGCWQIVHGVEFYSYQLDMSLNEGITGRIYSFFSNPNNFHTFITMLLPFALGLFISEKSTRGRVFCVLVLAFGLAASFATYSRSGWIGLILALMVLVTLTDWRYLLLLLVLGILALPFLPSTILTRITTIGNMKDSSTRYRLQIYNSFSLLLKRCWPTGVGLGTDATWAALHELPPMEDGNFALHSHNNYMQLCAEMGIVGVTAYTLALLGRVKNAFAAAALASGELRPLAAAAAGSMLGIMVMGLVDYTWYYPRSMFVFWFLYGVMTVCHRLARVESGE